MLVTRQNLNMVDQLDNELRYAQWRTLGRDIRYGGTCGCYGIPGRDRFYRVMDRNGRILPNKRQRIERGIGIGIIGGALGAIFDGKRGAVEGAALGAGAALLNDSRYGDAVVINPRKDKVQQKDHEEPNRPNTVLDEEEDDPVILENRTPAKIDIYAVDPQGRKAIVARQVLPGGRKKVPYTPEGASYVASGKVMVDDGQKTWTESAQIQTKVIGPNHVIFIIPDAARGR